MFGFVCLCLVACCLCAHPCGNCRCSCCRFLYAPPLVHNNTSLDFLKGRGTLTVDLSFDETGDDQESAGVEDLVGKTLLVPEELVGVDDFATLDPDGVVLDDLVVSEDLAVGDFDHLGLVFGDGCVGLGRGGCRSSEG